MNAEPLPAGLAHQALCAATARLLAAVAACAGAAGLMAALGAGALLLHGGGWGVAWPVLALLPLERLWALRLRLDAGLFCDLAAAADLRAGLHGLDIALQVLGLRRSSPAPRGLGLRIRGARRLALQHGAIVGLQLTLVMAGLVAQAGRG